MKINRIKYTLDGSGTEIPNFNIIDDYEYYLVVGSSVAVGNYLISVTGTPTENDVFILKWRGSLDITTNGASFTILGQSITANQLLYDFDAICTYNGSSWDVFIDRSETGVTTETANIKNNAVTNAKLAQMAANTIKANNTGSTADPQDVAISSLTGLNYWSLTGNSGTSAGTNFIGTTDNQDLVFKRNSVELGRLDSSDQNITFGTSFLFSSGLRNTGLGYAAMLLLSTGNDNTAVGRNALATNTTGSGNVGVGAASGSVSGTVNNTTVVGFEASCDYDNSICLGKGAIADATYQFAIPDDVTTIKFKGIVYTLPTVNAAGVLTNDGSGNLTWA